MDMSRDRSNMEYATEMIGRIDATGWPLRPTPPVSGQRQGRFQVVVKRSVLNEVHRHGLSDTGIEVGGVLVGNYYRDGRGPFLYVESLIRGAHTANQAAQVTFTAETWNGIQDVMERSHQDQKIIGWYHTHPGFGIFLSQMDLFIHSNFFNLPWQVALVYDPIGGDLGVFVWEDEQAKRDGFLVEEDEESAVPITDYQVPERQPPSNGDGHLGVGGSIAGMEDLSPGEMAMLSLAEMKLRLTALEQKQKWVLALVALLALVTLVWPLVFLALFALRPSPPLDTPPAQMQVEQKGEE